MSTSRTKASKLISVLVSLAMVATMVVPATAAAASKVKLKQGKTVAVTLYSDSATQKSTTLKAAGKKLKWKSSKKKVATVTKKGKVTAKKPGKTVITAKVGKKTFKAKVAVKQVSISAKTLALAVGASGNLSVVGDKLVSATSSDTSVATVSAAGAVTALKAGTATVTLKAKNKKSYTCAVTVTGGEEQAPEQPQDANADGKADDKTGDNAGDTAGSNTDKPSAPDNPDTPANPDKPDTPQGDPKAPKADSAAALKALLTDGNAYDSIELDLAGSGAETVEIEGASKSLASTELIVNAPKATVVNRVKFKRVTIKAVAKDTYTEHADNDVDVQAKDCHVVVADKATVNLKVSEGAENVKLENKGTVTPLRVAAATTVQVRNAGEQPVIKTYVEARATLDTDAQLDIDASAKATLVLQPGSTGTKVTTTDAANAPDTFGVGAVQVRVVKGQDITDVSTVVAQYSKDVDAGIYKSITGKVVAATEPVSGATVYLLAYEEGVDASALANAGGVRTAQTDASGIYTFADVEAGNYNLLVRKDGFADASQVLMLPGAGVEQDANYNCEDINLLAAGETGAGSVSGRIIDATTTDDGIEGITIRVRKGQNALTGTPVATTLTGEDGAYEFGELAAGIYTFEAVDMRGGKTVYTSTSFTVILRAKEAITGKVDGMSPALGEGEVRFVLSWGDRRSGAPADLDSHLWGPTSTAGKYFHTAYYDEEYDEGDIRIADLDRDDTDWSGPETTTVRQVKQGTYAFYIHDYTNRYATHSDALGYSAARVDVYKGDYILRTFYVPTGAMGTVWNVCTFDIVNNAISEVGTTDYESTPERVGQGFANADIQVTGVKANDLVTSASVYSSRIVLKTTAALTEANVGQVVPVIAGTGATYEVEFTETDRGSLTVTSADGKMTATYSIVAVRDYGSLKVTGIELNDTITGYEIYEDSYDGTPIINIRSKKTDLESLQASIEANVTPSGTTYRVHEKENSGTDEDGDEWSRTETVLTVTNGSASKDYVLKVRQDWADLYIVDMETNDMLTSATVVNGVRGGRSYVNIRVKNTDFSKFKDSVKPIIKQDGAKYEVKDDDGDYMLTISYGGVERTYNLYAFMDWGDLRILNIPTNDVVTEAKVFEEYSSDDEDDEYGSGYDIIRIKAKKTGYEDLKGKIEPVIKQDGATFELTEDEDGNMELVISDGEHNRRYRVYAAQDWGTLEVTAASAKGNAISKVRISEDEDSGSMWLRVYYVADELTKDALEDGVVLQYGEDVVSHEFEWVEDEAWSDDADGRWVLKLTSGNGVERILDIYTEYDYGDLYIDEDETTYDDERVRSIEVWTSVLWVELQNATFTPELFETIAFAFGGEGITGILEQDAGGTYTYTISKEGSNIKPRTYAVRVDIRYNYEFSVMDVERNGLVSYVSIDSDDDGDTIWLEGATEDFDGIKDKIDFECGSEVEGHELVADENSPSGYVLVIRNASGLERTYQIAYEFDGNPIVDLSTFKLNGIDAYQYTGDYDNPLYALHIELEDLYDGDDYETSYYELDPESGEYAEMEDWPVEVGSYKLVLTGATGRCTGSVEKKFDIVAENSLKVADVALNGDRTGGGETYADNLSQYFKGGFDVSEVAIGSIYLPGSAGSLEPDEENPEAFAFSISGFEDSEGNAIEASAVNEVGVTYYAVVVYTGDDGQYVDAARTRFKIIDEYDLANAECELDSYEFVATGENVQPKPEVRAWSAESGGYVDLVEGTDYELRYGTSAWNKETKQDVFTEQDTAEPGEYFVQVLGKGAYSGSFLHWFTISEE